MKILRSSGLRVILVVVIAILFAGCDGPTLDNSLSPPIIGKPIYACAEVIAFSGADRDAKIIVYVNGTNVIEVNTWMGWGEIQLPSALNNGDIVSAAQVINNRISEKTREPVTVVNLPPDLMPEEKLKTPEIVPPLYECQKVVRVGKVLEGATVVLRNVDGDTWTGMTPYSLIRFVTPELELGKWYDASQSICKDTLTSDWSPKETVQARPASMPQAIIHEPVVVGSDACRVDGLIPGADVKIYADDGSGPVQVGGGAALEAATIFRINPPFDENFKYYAVQSLCDLESAPPDGIPPVKDVPAPTVQAPCGGDFYVTVCDTVVLSTVQVFVDGARVAQAAGNGGCVTMALGDATTFAGGAQITAQQFVAGQPSSVSAAVPVAAGGAPAYDPAYWNNPTYQRCNNCYNYGCDIRTDTFAQPGYAHGISLSLANLNCTDVGNAAIADGLAPQPEKICKGCTHLVALVIAPGDDYHWYRLDDNGRWSHKPGGSPATDLDASGNQIADPETADRYYSGPDYTLDYNTFCTYYCVDKKFVVIDGRRACNP